MSCATTSSTGYAEAESCPAAMSEEQRDSGRVRCTAMCSSYARDFASFDDDCKCRCAPAVGGGYRPKTQKSFKTPFNNQM
jgi:hypothetical protein